MGEKKDAASPPPATVGIASELANDEGAADADPAAAAANADDAPNSAAAEVGAPAELPNALPAMLSAAKGDGPRAAEAAPPLAPVLPKVPKPLLAKPVLDAVGPAAALLALPLLRKSTGAAPANRELVASATTDGRTGGLADTAGFAAAVISPSAAVAAPLLASGCLNAKVDATVAGLTNLGGAGPAAVLPTPAKNEDTADAPASGPAAAVVPCKIAAATSELPAANALVEEAEAEAEAAAADGDDALGDAAGDADGRDRALSPLAAGAESANGAE